MESIAVSGIGAICSLGNSVDEIWKNFQNKKPGIKQITRFDTSLFKTKIAGEIDNFDPLKAIKKKDVHKMDKLSMYAIQAVSEAIEQSGLMNLPISRDRIGLFWSSGNGGIISTEEAVNFINEPEKFPVFQQIKILGDAPVGWIAQYFKITGVNMSIMAACSSAMIALQTAQVYINAGLCDFAVVGGAEAPITPTVIAGFSKMKALSSNNSFPKHAAKAFSKNRDGFVVGEGAAAIVIGKLNEAIKYNLPILAQLKSCNSLNDGEDFVHPNYNGMLKNISKCLEVAQLSPNKIDAVFPHATSTLLGDKTEYLVLKSVFDKSLSKLFLMNIKNAIGHLLGASGAISSVLAIKCLIEQHVIPNNYLKDETDYEDLLIDFDVKQTILNHILCNSAGFGGHHASCIFSKIN